MPGESENESSPYWCWTHKAEEAEEAEYTSDEDDCSEIASDEDAPADEPSNQAATKLQAGPSHQGR